MKFESPGYILPGSLGPLRSAAVSGKRSASFSRGPSTCRSFSNWLLEMEYVGATDPGLHSSQRTGPWISWSVAPLQMIASAADWCSSKLQRPG